MKPALRRNDLLYPEESYKILGVLFDVYNELGPGHHEKYYQRAAAAGFTKIGLQFREQFYTPLHYAGKVVGRYYFDFLIEGKIIVELKKGNRFSHRHIKQVAGYPKTSGLRLAILVNCGPDGVLFKRIVNYS